MLKTIRQFVKVYPLFRSDKIPDRVIDRAVMGFFDKKGAAQMAKSLEKMAKECTDAAKKLRQVE